MPPFEAALMQRTWDAIAPRYQAYALALPGSARFICQAELCDAHCCRVFSVNLGESEVARMERESGLRPVMFLECENGAPIALPLAQPYLLARADNRCRLLGDDLSCNQYHGRPNACRLYPHFVVFIDAAANRPVTADLDGIARSFADRPAGPYVPLLLRHVECPGFTGPPMDTAEWETLLRDTYQLQYQSA
jgi:Fe-S-cluster containining protein